MARRLRSAAAAIEGKSRLHFLIEIVVEAGVIATAGYFLAALNLTLITPISIGNQLAGLIGLGPEFAGGQYGHDDFDLLTALGSQTASALLAVRMAEKLAHAREQQAWNRLSAFVLHDIKNAATMLSMLQENAPEHIHEPEFQQDMLELVDNTLRRKGHVDQRFFGSLAQAMHGMGHYLFAGSRIYGDQYRIIGFAGILETLKHVVHRRGNPEHATQRSTLTALPLEPTIGRPRAMALIAFSSSAFPVTTIIRVWGAREEISDRSAKPCWGVSG